ncbi:MULTISPECIES: MFS transporter [unclassified Devosia]|uniref:MFS transporter n=1 Tax=unclassified Devosia TaxID=196773 RepID=UPI001AC83E14|nr:MULTISPECIES: MFS transporter [unclassified Devosia]MBN9360299.1 MFS transporter [Devosia sp.]
MASRLIMAVFFVQALAFGAWLPRIPDIQARLGLSAAELGYALLGLPVGLLLALPFVSIIVGRTGGRTAVLWSLPAFIIAICLPAFAPNGVVLFLALALAGLAMSTIELGMNIVADETEKRDGVVIMSRCHGFWSLGMMVGSLTGAAAAHWGLAPQVSIPAVAVLALLIGPAVARRLPRDPATGSAGSEAPVSGLFIPGAIMLGICIVALASNILEGAAADWSAVYLRQVLGADPGAAGLGYAAYSLLMAVGRFNGDWVRSRWGGVIVARACYALALAGLLLVVFAPDYPWALAGFALAGFGGSVGVPLAVSAAASAPGTHPPPTWRWSHWCRWSASC